MSGVDGVVWDVRAARLPRFSPKAPQGAHKARYPQPIAMRPCSLQLKRRGWSRMHAASLAGAAKSQPQGKRPALGLRVGMQHT